jgi:hypothetical protein
VSVVLYQYCTTEQYIDCITEKHDLPAQCWRPAVLSEIQEPMIQCHDSVTIQFHDTVTIMAAPGRLYNIETSLVVVRAHHTE